MPASGAHLLDHIALLLQSGHELLGLDGIAIGYQALVLLGQLERNIEGLSARDHDLADTILALEDGDHAVDVADLGLALGHTRLEQPLDSR